MSKLQIVILSILGLFACVIFVAIGLTALFLLPSLSQQTKSEQTISQSSAEPIRELPTVTATRREVRGTLPGLQASDIKVSLEERDFSCTQAEKFKTANVYVWTCQQETSSYLFRIDIYGETLTTVDYISATALDYSGSDSNLPAEFLGFIATVPYDAAQPNNAREWVSKNIRSEESFEATFGQVKYELYGPSEAKTLTIGIFKW